MSEILFVWHDVGNSLPLAWRRQFSSSGSTSTLLLVWLDFGNFLRRQFYWFVLTSAILSAWLDVCNSLRLARLRQSSSAAILFSVSTSVILFVWLHVSNSLRQHVFSASSGHRWGLAYSDGLSWNLVASRSNNYCSNVFLLNDFQHFQ